MVYVKPTVHLSRLAGAALKSFTHGYAQTVVAASQSSYAAQNTSATPLADNLLGRWRKAEKHKFQNALQQVDGARQASTSVAAPRPDTSHHDAGLEKYFDAWQKLQRSEPREWHQFQFARTIEWQPPTTVPELNNFGPESAAVIEDLPQDIVESRPPLLKRSYTTSALNDFGKVFEDDLIAEATALAQVNDAIAEEIQKSKEKDDSSESGSVFVESPATSLAASERQPDISAKSQTWTDQLLALVQAGHHADIPATFRSMLVSEESQKALEVYSDMLQRGVVPDSSTYNLFVELLAQRAMESFALLEASQQRLTRYGGLEQSGKFMFTSSQLEHAMLAEDNSLYFASKIFSKAVSSAKLSSEACTGLIVACAEKGHVDEMFRVYDHANSSSISLDTSIFPPMIRALGITGDLRSAVEVYDHYKELALLHNTGKADIQRQDNNVYAALIRAYGTADRLKGGLKFLSDVQAATTDPIELKKLREVVAIDALLPLALKDTTLRNAFDLIASLEGTAHKNALTITTVHAADNNLLEQSTVAFDMLAGASQDLVDPSLAMLAMHVRNGNVEAAEPYWRIIEAAPATPAFIEPATMRTIALISMGQAERGLRQARRIFSRIRDAQPESAIVESSEQIAEAVEVIGNFMLRNNLSAQSDASVELLRAMVENGGLIGTITDHFMARFGPEQISRFSAADLELVLRIQAGAIVNETSADIAAPARFACLLENIVAKSIMPSAETETIIERTLINLDKNELSTLWHNYRYPPSPMFTTPSFASPIYTPRPVAEDSFDPYMSKTDIKGSNSINELLERPQGRRLAEALTKFRNMRRIGRVPRMFTYGKLIESAAKENNLSLAHEILELAKQDVPFDATYRVVRFGWQQILDHMVAGCLTLNRRDLAAQYHQDLRSMGAAPSANTFGLYITTLKENTKTFDEATEAVKIFHQAKAEGVEPSSFLYNALIGKLGKARRIDDCLFYFAEMRSLGVRPTSVTYGTIVNALCRVSDEKFAEEIFEEMEACTNYKPRPAPYHSLMQYFLTTKRDRVKVLSYYERMRSQRIEPTMHTFKLLIDAHATLEPINMSAARDVLDEIKNCGFQPEAVHWAALIHAQGCVKHDMDGARKMFDEVVSSGQLRLQPCLYQAMFESLNANHESAQCEALLADMSARRIEYTPYIANALIHGWTSENNITNARAAFDRVKVDKREPSTYEAMVRAYLAVEDRESARTIVREALSRGYPSAVAAKIAELVR
ncbi:hypothetical protein AMS68_004364 [Peltaster fructicola]|uniref:Tetratricopeptide repeat domain-containing protein n=1 Tax=Peltaster fructicola TaxID=286661 RepID=A0A6H0XVR0_9PEZI|nr:hypothetical protein AMS68_004364 [Peltaster fructicola]